jgi:uncharacterized membrane protein YphA (DoxX/SURF4 family)
MVKVDVGFLSPQGGEVGAELDLALIAGFLAILLAGPGKISLDYGLGIERGTAREVSAGRRTG